MRPMYRRQRQQYLFAAMLGVIALANLLFFLILFRPARVEYYRLQESVEQRRAEVRARGQSVERLRRLSAQLETSAQDRQQLYTKHFIPRDAGWSEILRQLDTLVRGAGVKNASKNYAISPGPQYGLYSVTIDMPVAGTYSSIVNLIGDLEDSETFFIINSIDVRGGAEVEATEVSLSLNLETFFYQ